MFTVMEKVGLVALALLLFTLTTAASEREKPPPACNSDIYCFGKLLHVIQTSRIYPDSKTFVDMKMKYSPNETLQRFEDMMRKLDQKPNKNDVEKFVNATFDPAGSEFEEFEPEDWIQKPNFLEKITDPDLKEWANQLNMLWKVLGRKMIDDVRIHPEQYSIIYVPNPVIVPGGRFREFYYWDSYWIMRGLLISEMYHTVRGMLENFLSIVETYGFIPNGGRVYYTRRSQPPLLIPMMKSYIDATHDKEFLQKNINTLEKEFKFWIVNRTVTIEKDGHHYTLARYKDSSSGPRPESYREDIEHSEIFKTDEEKEDFYTELKAAAESGWDFSSRWFITNGTNKGKLTNLKTRYIIPVDLNAIIHWNANLMSDFYKELGNLEKADEFSKIAEKWLMAVTKILWHEEVGAWLDYDILNDIKRDYFYPTNISPFWTNCYDLNNREYYVSRVLKYLEKSQIQIQHGGTPSSFEHTGEQWDYPNAWPPLQYILIVGLEQTEDAWAQDLAYELTEKWVRSNYKAYNDSHTMYEKYDATLSGGHGGGGEYQIVTGFGWTNGVIMELLEKYGDKLTAEERFATPGQMESVTSGIQQSSVSSIASILTALLALLATFSAGFIGVLVYKKRYQAYPNDKRKLCPKLLGGYMELKDLTFD
uniref:Trehalase n=2 Tax=Clastoptera arizonana TaxID=38151 RepID=A0A1B6EEF7_9HEMI